MSLIHANLYSDVLGRSAEFEALLPDTPAPETGFPTLFLLHGMTDDHTAWQRFTAIERYADEYGLAVIMPDARLSWYTNAAGERYFDWISDELVHAVRRIFPRLSHRRMDTFAAGLSMGGYGALRCALKRSDVFSKCALLSGALDVALLAQDPMPLGRPFRWEDVFDPIDQISGSEHDLFLAAAECVEKRPQVWMCCGLEDALLDMNLRMRDRLRDLGYSVRFSSSSGGHDWGYWDCEIQNALKWLTAGEEAEACP